MDIATANTYPVKVVDGATSNVASFIVYFGDVSSAHPAYDYVNLVAAKGITVGCGGANFCPASAVTRAQMAVFLLKAKHGAGYLPPSCTGLFSDVACPSGFAVDWIEQLYNEGITGGCDVVCSCFDR
jgi:hypothetical protein